MKSRPRIVVVGDAMLDEYIEGTANRISPEAPVPVVRATAARTALGGAAHTAACVNALGGAAQLIAPIGQDKSGAVLMHELAEHGVNDEAVVIENGLTTTTKTRVIANGQQVVRIDRETEGAADERTVETIIAHATQAVREGVDACVISDYAKGAASDGVIGAVIDACRKHDVPLVIDPKRPQFDIYRGATIVTPNVTEASLACGQTVTTPAEAERAARSLAAQCGPETAVLITRGGDGMCLRRADGQLTHIQPEPVEVYDVTGAGDAVVACLAMALALRCELTEACVIANRAGARAVKHHGAVPVTAAEIGWPSHHLDHVPNGVRP